MQKHTAKHKFHRRMVSVILWHDHPVYLEQPWATIDGWDDDAVMQMLTAYPSRETAHYITHQAYLMQQSQGKVEGSKLYSILDQII